MNELALFAGAGGGLLASELLGWNTIGAVEINQYARSVLLARQRDGMLRSFPIWDDVCTFDGRPWRGLVDIVTGGFPCTDISWAWDGKGLSGKQSGLWWEQFRIVRESLPKCMLAENVGNLRKRGLDSIRDSMRAIGYHTRDLTLLGSDLGAPHPRIRTWVFSWRDWEPVIFAGDCQSCDCCEEPVCPYCRIHYSECPCPGPHSEDDGWTIREEDWGIVAYPDGTGCQEQWGASTVSKKYPPAECSPWWSSEPGMVRVANGMANRVDRLRALGNGQIPAVAATAFRILSEGII